jgi:hypothetical protein
MSYLFPFGERVHKLEQEDRTPKRIFVLGVYASAVHAKWINEDRIVCQALAVASEPRIFWDGNTIEAERIISGITVPREVGRLVLPNGNLNGPSSKVLSLNILKPLGTNREGAWLCDLLPESRMNPNQKKVITERYNPLINTYGLNEVTVPDEDGEFCNPERRAEITREILDSQAEDVVLLGDIPIQQYLCHVTDFPFKSLREFTLQQGYGMRFPVRISSRMVNIIPIAHPRQIGGLGRSSRFWFDQHAEWEGRQE